MEKQKSLLLSAHLEELPTPSSSSSSSSSSCKRITIASVGSRGDVQPYIAMALLLQSRGHSVTIATEARLAPLCAEYGLPMRTIVGDSAGILFEPSAVEALAKGSFLSLMRLSAAWEKRWK
jgi:UDP:flavonoid glycosyltransferase YjiC (YdhE family)